MTNAIDPRRIATHHDDDLQGDEAHVLYAEKRAPPPPELPTLEEDHLARALRDQRAASRPNPHGGYVNAPEVHLPPVGRGLADFLQAARQPYRLPDGTRAEVTPAFRMFPGYDTQIRALPDARRELTRLAPAVGLTAADVERALYGRPSLDALHRLTQALIDTGKLPPPAWDEEPAENRVRRLQFQYCLGYDCAGFAKLAFAASRGLRLEDLPHGLADFRENLDDLDGKGFHTVRGWSEVRAGDIVALAAPEGEAVGHRVIVQQTHDGLTDDERRKLTAAWTSARQAAERRNPPSPALIERAVALGNALSAGRVQVVIVQASWGSGGAAERGGVRQETWYRYEGKEGRTHWTWTVGAAFAHGDQPYAHPLIGVYRWRGDR